MYEVYCPLNDGEIGGQTNEFKNVHLTQKLLILTECITTDQQVLE